MCTSPSEVTYVCLLDLDSTASRSRHGSLLCPDPQIKQAVTCLNIRFAQIQASPDEANTTDVLHGISRPKPRNPTSNSISPPCANNGSWNSHTRRRRFSTPSLDLSHTRRQDSLVVHQFTWPENLVVNRCCTRLQVPPGFLTSPPRVDEHARSCHAPKHCC